MCEIKYRLGLLRLILITIFFCILSYLPFHGQNMGLSKPQDPADLPKSRVAVIQPKILPEIAEETELVKTSG